jgi:hypothetical protein
VKLRRDLDEKELARQRGEDPKEVVGHTPSRPREEDPSPEFQPVPGRADRYRGLFNEIGRERRPHREDVLPYLLIRAFSPGDRGQRPPLWPPTVCWESPDLLLIDASYTGPFDPARLVLSPVAGRSYRVFVRVWNLGLFPAVGVHVRAWAINPGFFGAGNQNDPYYRQHHIGGAWIDELTDRRHAGCTAVVELDQPWNISPTETGHECLIASVTCPADHFAGPLDANGRRHVGQRNLWILEPAQSADDLVGTLARLVPPGFTLELTHGGPAVLPLLQGLGGPRLKKTAAPALGEIRGGVDIGASAHLLTAFETGGRTVIAGSAALEKAAARTRFGRRRVDSAAEPGTHPFAEPAGTRRLLEQLGPERWPELGLVTDQPLREALRDGLARILGAEDLHSRTLAQALGGPPRATHLLRFTLTTPRGNLVGGYSITVRA